MLASPLWLPTTLLALTALTPAHGEEAATAAPVVVELFTSQGCSSCPPADAYLGKLAHEPGILALGFHIDYWNYIGWTDPYSIPRAAERQRSYAQRLGLHYVYTPQMVVNGANEGVAEPEKIEPLLRAAMNKAHAGPAIALARRGDNTIHVHIGTGSAASTATLWLVGFDREHKTKVLRGENEGETALDYQVVRSFTAIGKWDGKALDLDIPAATASGDHAALLLQVGGSGPILATATLMGPSS